MGKEAKAYPNCPNTAQAVGIHQGIVLVHFLIGRTRLRLNGSEQVKQPQHSGDRVHVGSFPLPARAYLENHLRGESQRSAEGTAPQHLRYLHAQEVADAWKSVILPFMIDCHT